MFHDMFVHQSGLKRAQGIQNWIINPERPRRSRYVCFTICFTLCLFISPDLDGHRAPQGTKLIPNGQRYVSRDMFTICLFISPDLDGHRAPKMKYCPRTICRRRDEAVGVPISRFLNFDS